MMDNDNWAKRLSLYWQTLQPSSNKGAELWKAFAKKGTLPFPCALFKRKGKSLGPGCQSEMLRPQCHFSPQLLHFRQWIWHGCELQFCFLEKLCFLDTVRLVGVLWEKNIKASMAPWRSCLRAVYKFSMRSSPHLSLKTNKPGLNIHLTWIFCSSQLRKNCKV